MNLIARITIALAAVIASETSTAAQKVDAADLSFLDIPYVRHVLPNGLTLIIHEDHKVPLVAVNMWYHVGSKDEHFGRTGFAHLFEHLMFKGSEHHNSEFFAPLESIGATKMNGTTWLDRTNYFQNVPTAALERTLWLESDRMGWMLGAIDQQKLDDERAIIQNEKRLSENQPYGKVGELIATSTYPVGHPYSWTPIGSIEDLNAASLEDVRDWFRTWYGAANAVLVVAGDIDATQVKKKVEHYFGDIPSGPTLRRHDEWIAKMEGARRTSIEDRVPQARIYKVWNIPGYRRREFTLLNVAANILGRGNNSRFYQRLVHKDRLATAVSVDIGPFELGSQFQVIVTVIPGGDVAAAERAIDEEMARFLDEGPTAEELGRVKTVTYSKFVRSLERVDGYGGKSEILAQNEVYTGASNFYRQQLAWEREASIEDVQSVTREWLSDGVFVLNVAPQPEYHVAATGADRLHLPEVGAPATLSLPALQHMMLSNGLEIVVAERHNAPVAQFTLIFDAGYAADLTARPGTTRLAMAMLTEGTERRSKSDISLRAETLGAEIKTSNTLDRSMVTLDALSGQLPESLELLSDLILGGNFPISELERARTLQMAAIQQEMASPRRLALRLLPRFIYGADHAYGNPLSGNGNESAVSSLTRDDLLAFRQKFLTPDRATMLVVGDVNVAGLRPMLEQYFGAWGSQESNVGMATRGRDGSIGVGAAKTIANVVPPAGPRVFLVNRTGAEQSVIVAGRAGPRRNDPDHAALATLNAVLGGKFVSRLNMNLREEKKWSYSISSRILETKGPGLFYVSSAVQTDKTVESMREILRELREIGTTRPPTDSELRYAKGSITLALPSRNETVSEITESIISVLAFGLPDSYWDDFVGEVETLAPLDVAVAASKVMRLDELTWVVVGDLAQIEAAVRAAGIGDVRVVSAEGD